MIEILFLACWLPPLYCYVLYPLVVLAAGSLPRRAAANPPPDDAVPPRMTLMIPAHDEQETIGRKLRNCLTLDHPSDRLEILVLSDGSTDRTVERARDVAARSPAGPKITVCEFPRRRGKTACINDAIRLATGEIIVHTDANTVFDPDALRRIGAPFADPRVGCVVGELIYTNLDEPPVAGGEGIYWRYENLLKQAESRLGSTITANGGIYAIRRELFEPLPDHIAGDAADPLLVARSGYRVLFERRARAFERAASTLSEEFERKVRIITQGIAAYVWVGGLLLPPRPLLAAQLLSHKLLRWLVPLFLIAAICLNVLLAHQPAYAVLLGGQILFYGLGAAGILRVAASRPGSRPGGMVWRPALLAAYFMTVNAAALAGIWQFLTGVRRPTWEKSPSTRSL